MRLTAVLASLVTGLLLTACASTRENAAETADLSAQRAASEVGAGVSKAAKTTRDGLPDAATQPLEDLNVKRDPIPPVLLEIDYVYAAEPRPTCEAIAAEIDRLSIVLGRDYDQDEQERTLGEKSGEAAGDVIIDGIRGVTTDVIPLRSVVRRVSGARAWDKKTARAFSAGQARRAYLKGLGLASGCQVPAAPTVTAPPKPESDSAAIERRQPTSGPDNAWMPAPSN